jgi:predicted DNA-binding transcriptional regulator YafY
MEIIPNVLKLGNEAQLLEPAEGRKEIKKVIQQMAKDYAC